MNELINAASGNWDQLAAFAWKSFQFSGPGAVLVLAEDLLDGEQGELPMNYFAMEDIPPGDDFRSLMAQYDPGSQVMLMIGLEDGEQVLVIEALEGQRRRPDSFESDRPDC
tara:strand:+ start:637 stop:969 length:333 start_codon:yes stop_codon:yes gene_type:complete